MGRTTVRLTDETTDMVRRVSRRLVADLGTHEVTQDRVVRAALIVSDHHPQLFLDTLKEMLPGTA